MKTCCSWSGRADPCGTACVSPAKHTQTSKRSSLLGGFGTIAHILVNRTPEISHVITHVASLQQRIEDITRVRKGARRKWILALDAPSIGRPRLAKVRHVDVVPTAIGTTESARKPCRGGCALQPGGGDGRHGALAAGRVVGPNVRHRRVRQGVVEQGNDLVV